jgi:hypothetical protein
LTASFIIDNASNNKIIYKYITQVLKEQSNVTYKNYFTKLPKLVPCLLHII